MKLLAPLAAALSLAGRHGTLIAAGSIFVGLAAPPLAAFVKPALGPAIVAMLTLAFLRVDPAELRRHWTRPGLTAAAVAWSMLAVPTVLGTLGLMAGLGHLMPGLYFMLVLQLAAPGLMSSPALAALLGLDVALTLASLIVGAAIVPLTAALFTHFFLGKALISPLGFALKLFAIIAGSALAASVIRRLAGRAFIETQRLRIDGLSVLAMALFAVAAMDGVTAHFISDPLLVTGLAALAFALAIGLIVVTAIVFRPAGRARALAIGLIAGNRNIGLMLAATGFAVPDVSWLYFALAQFPIYLLPHLLKPLARRVQTTAALGDGRRRTAAALLRRELRLQLDQLLEQVGLLRSARLAARAGACRRRGHAHRTAVGIGDGRGAGAVGIGVRLGAGAGEVGRVQQGREPVLLGAAGMMAAPARRQFALADAAVAIGVELAEQRIGARSVDARFAERAFEFALADLAVAVFIDAPEQAAALPVARRLDP